MGERQLTAEGHYGEWVWVAGARTAELNAGAYVTFKVLDKSRLKS